MLLSTTGQALVGDLGLCRAPAWRLGSWKDCRASTSPLEVTEWLRTLSSQLILCQTVAFEEEPPRQLIEVLSSSKTGFIQHPPPQVFPPHIAIRKGTRACKLHQGTAFSCAPCPAGHAPFFSCLWFIIERRVAGAARAAWRVSKGTQEHRWDWQPGRAIATLLRLPIGAGALPVQRSLMQIMIS